MTADDRRRRLEKTVTDLQVRFGLRAIGRSPRAAVPPTVSTGFSALDEALGVGGLPLGRLSEIIGIPTSGMATLALKVVAEAQAAESRGDSPAVYLDLEKTFDPDYATRCGVDLGRLLVVRPYTVRQGLAMLPDFALDGGFSVVVVDGPLRAPTANETAEMLATTLARIIAPLSRSDCALLFLSSLPPGSAPTPDGYPAQVGLPHYAAVRLLIRRERWLYRQHDIAGYAAQVLVVKNRLGTEGRRVEVAITFNGTVHGEEGG